MWQFRRRCLPYGQMDITQSFGEVSPSVKTKDKCLLLLRIVFIGLLDKLLNILCKKHSIVPRYLSFKHQKTKKLKKLVFLEAWYLI